jgi:toxin YoeB
VIYELEYTPEAEKDVKALQKSGETAAILKLRKLLLELTEHPATGTGRPKSLGGNRAMVEAHYRQAQVSLFDR